MYQWQQYHFIDELAREHIYIHVFNPGSYKSIVEANEKLISEAKSKPYSLFMTPHNEELLAPETLAIIKKIGIPTLLICYDNLLVPFYHKNICSLFDLVWLTSIETKYMFDKWGAKTIFLPYAANPALMTNNKETEMVKKIVFIGNPYGSRSNTINSLLNNDQQVTVFCKQNKTAKKNVINKKFDLQQLYNYCKFSIGRKVVFSRILQIFMKESMLNTDSPFIEMRGVLSFEDMYATYRKYALCLAGTSARSTGILKNPVNVINLRNFEIPMCGGIEFCKYNKELSQYFEEDKEIIFYRSEEEMIDKAKYYLSDPNEKTVISIKKAARRRAVADHTWTNRFQKVFCDLNIR